MIQFAQNFSVLRSILGKSHRQHTFAHTHRSTHERAYHIVRNEHACITYGRVISRAHAAAYSTTQVAHIHAPAAHMATCTVSMWLWFVCVWIIAHQLLCRIACGYEEPAAIHNTQLPSLMFSKRQHCDRLGIERLYAAGCPCALDLRFCVNAWKALCADVWHTLTYTDTARAMLYLSWKKHMSAGLSDASGMFKLTAGRSLLSYIPFRQ